MTHNGDQIDPPAHRASDLDLRDERVERALDTLLDGGDVSEADEKTIAALELQHRVNDTITRNYAPPAPPQALLDKLQNASDQPTDDAKVRPAVTDAATSANSASKWINSPWTAAALLLLCGGSWLLFGIDRAEQLLFGPDSQGAYALRGVVETYQESVEKGFEPDWFCEDEKRFADTFHERQGIGLWLDTLPEGTAMVGLAYLEGFTRDATCLLARVDGAPVIVFVGQSDQINRKNIQTDSESGEMVHILELENLTLVEVSPFDTPRVATYLYAAPPPTEPTGRVPGA